MTSVLPGTTLTLQTAVPRDWNMADLQGKLGGIPADRIRLFPPPGWATEEDVSRIAAEDGRLCELEDGILVEKTMGWYESLIAVLIATEITNFLRRHDLGRVLGADGSLKILPGMVKIPDVSFISWDRWPRVDLPRRPIPELVPDLAVEVLSDSNTDAEMAAKLATYFQAGVRLVWYVDPATRSARSFTGDGQRTEVIENSSLDGGDVLPGFRLNLNSLFEEANRKPPDRGGG